MKKWMKVLVVCGVIAGTSSVPAWVDSPASVYVTAGTASQDRLTKELTTALTQRVSSARFTYSGSLGITEEGCKCSMEQGPECR